MPYSVYAALLSGSLAVIELLIARKPLAPRAIGWVVVLFGFDAGSGLLAYAVLGEVLRGLAWYTGAWTVVVPGLCGSAILRAQLAMLGSGQESSYYGPAVRYRRIQQKIQARIDALGAAAQSTYVVKAIPEIASGVREEDLTTIVLTFVSSLDQLPGEQQEELRAYCEQTLGDAGIDYPLKIRYIVQKLVDNGGRECVRALTSYAKAPHPSPPAVCAVIRVEEHGPDRSA